ncbi:MAG: prolyl oligopeptidase family serine peptidase [Clostridia bacterium]|nr:prolyl oligopeptidase family serine peptidase [Clostridia bacterium]
MKSFSSGLLILILLTVAFFIASCGGNDSTASAETTAEPVTEAPVPSVTLVEDGESDYVVVCDITDSTLKRLVTDFVEKVRKEFGVTLAIKKPGEGSFEHEIVIGNVRDSAASVAATLEERSDFAISLVEDDLVICASDSRYYAYAFSYIEYEWMENAKNKTLSVSEADAIHRAGSELEDVPFLTYWRRHNYKIGIGGLKYLMDQTDVVLENGSIMKSYVYIPYEYDPAKSYPVLIHLHGSDAIGDGGAHLGSLNGAFNVKDSPLPDAIVLAPQCPYGNQWVGIMEGTYSVEAVPETASMKGVLTVLSQIEETYNTDKSRYYVRGYSMGGYGSWDLMARHPGLFAAALPICGGSDYRMAHNMLDVAIHTFHGEIDEMVPVESTRAVVAAIEALGGTKCEYFEQKGVNHGGWGEILDDADHLAWMFAQKRTITE